MIFDWVISFLKEAKGKKSYLISGLKNSNVTIIENAIFTSSFDLAASLGLQKVLKKDISLLDKKKFIGNSKILSNDVNRFFYSIKDGTDLTFNLFKNEKGTSLKDIIDTESKVLVLGNPGLGKTTELQKLAVQIWQDQSSTPIYRNLKNFTTKDSIDSFIGVNWARLENVVFIFDGIDEISDIQNFVSKLETFTKNMEDFNIKHKFVLSCRTNVYVDVIKQISDFEAFFLRDLKTDEGVKLLMSFCKKKIDINTNDDLIISMLQNPFQVQIIANFIKRKGKIPENTTEIWEQYIEKRLSSDEGFKFIRRRLNTPLIKTYSKLVSLTNELMKRTTFSDEDIYKIVSNNTRDFEEFKKNPLMHKAVTSNLWSFEHRNIQEYFAAAKLSGRDLVSIVNFIEIENSGRTHPSLFNTITFLLNILPKGTEKYNGVIDWFVQNEPELLFRADYDRIANDVRVKVFREYFERECVGKTLWVNINRKFELDRIARFGDCNNNFKYLMNFVENQKFHSRVRYSALELLKYFRIPNGKENEIKQYFLDELGNKGLEVGIKCQIINFFESKPLFKEDYELLNAIFLIFKNECNKQINAQLLHLIQDISNVDQFSEFIIQEFLYANELKPRREEDRVGRGNKFMVEKLIIKLNSPNHFLNVCQYYFDDSINMHYNQDYIENIINRCQYFIEQDISFLKKLFLETTNNATRYSSTNHLLKLILKTNNRDFAVKHFFLIDDFEIVSLFSAYLVDISNLEFVVNSIITKGIEDKEIEKFRNYIGNVNSRILASKFHDLMEIRGVNFELPVYTEEQQEKDRKALIRVAQENLDLVFDTSGILLETKKIFDDFDKELNWDSIDTLESNWYKKNGHSRIFISAPLKLIKELLPSGRYYKNTKITFEDVVRTIESNDYVQVILAQKLIEEFSNTNIPFDLSDSNKAMIENWSSNAIESMDFDNVVAFVDRKSWRYPNNGYQKIKTILFFHDLLGHELPKEFYLNILEYFEHDKSGEFDSEFKYIKERIDDEELFNQRIIHNIINRDLVSLSLSKHIEYALNNELYEAYPRIREYMLDEETSYNDSRIIELYFETTNDESLLLECCKDITSRKYWSCIRIMSKNNIYTDFCVDAAIAYFDEGTDIYLTNALEVLMQNNRIEALEILMESLAKKSNILSLRMMKYNNYSAHNDLDNVYQLFDVIYSDTFDSFEFGDYRNFFISYVSNIAKLGNDKMKEVFDILEKIKKKLEEKGSDLFHINLAIMDIKDKYLMSFEKVHSIEEAIDMIKD